MRRCLYLAKVMELRLSVYVNDLDMVESLINLPEELSEEQQYEFGGGFVR